MFVRDHNRPLLHEAMGLHSTEYDYEVFRITSQICRQVFPVELDMDHPSMRRGLNALVEISAAHTRAKLRGGPIGLVLQGVHAARAALTFARIFLLPVKSQALPQPVRMVPQWLSLTSLARLCPPIIPRGRLAR